MLLLNKQTHLVNQRSAVTISSAEGRWTVTAAILGSAMGFIDGTALNVVLPSLQQSLHANAADLFWVLNAYLLMMASLILVGGSLGDKLGRKKIFMTGILLFMAGSVLCGLSPNVTALIVCRVLQGVGGSLMIPGSLSLISSTITEKERGKAIGIWSAATTIVTMGGPVLGGAFGDAGLWRYIFFINIPIGLIAVFIVWRKVKESRDEDGDHAIDIPGAFFIAAGLSLLTFGCLRIPVIGFNHWEVYGSITCGIILLAVFLLQEKKSPHPMMPLNLFHNPVFSGTNLLTFLLYTGLGAAMLFLSLNLVQVQGYSQLASGLTFLPFTIMMVIFSGFAGKLADKYGYKKLLVAGPAIAGAGLLLLSLVKQTNGPADYWTTFFPGILVFGIGMAFTVAPLTSAVMGSIDDHHSGIASGVNNSITRISNVFANAVFGSLAILFFSGTLSGQLEKETLSPATKQAIIKEAANLGNAKVPDTVPAKERAVITKLYHQSFISAYADIMRVAAGFAFLAAITPIAFAKRGMKKH